MDNDIKDPPGTINRGVEATGIPEAPNVAKVNWLTGLRASASDALTNYPYHTAAIAAGTLVVANSVLTAVAPGIAMHTGGVSVATFALTATLTFSVLRAVGDLKIAFKQQNEDGRRVETRDLQHDSGQREMRALIGDLAGQIDHLATFTMSHALRQGPAADALENTPQAWEIRSGSDYYAVGGQLRLDQIVSRGPCGLKIDFDIERVMKIHVPRFHATAGANRIYYVLPSPDENPGAALNEQVRSHLLLFRMIKALADRSGIAVDLGKARVALAAGITGRSSFFVGTRPQLVDGKPVEFANTYSDHAVLFNVPRSMIDDMVTVNADSRIVEAYRNTARAIIERSTLYTIDELERRFGGDLPPLDPLPPLPPGSPSSVRAPTQAREFIVNGDHFTW